MACPDLLKTDVLKILNQIVQHFNGKGVKTFAVTHNSDDQLDTNFGANYQDFLDGYFWSFNWFYAGANRNEMCIEFPALLAQCGNTTRPSLLSDKMECFDIWLLLFDQVDCEECENHNRSVQDVAQEINQTLNRILKELYTYRLYEHITDGTFVWFSDANVAHLIGQGNFPYKQCTPCREVENTIPANTYRLEYREYESDEQHIGKFVKLTFCVCASENTTDFNFDIVNTVVGTTSCENC